MSRRRGWRVSKRLLKSSSTDEKRPNRRRGWGVELLKSIAIAIGVSLMAFVVMFITVTVIAKMAVRFGG